MDVIEGFTATFKAVKCQQNLTFIDHLLVSGFLRDIILQEDHFIGIKSELSSNSVDSVSRLCFLFLPGANPTYRAVLPD